MSYHISPDGSENYFLFQRSKATPHEDLLVFGVDLPMPQSIDCRPQSIVMTFAAAAPHLPDGKMISGGKCTNTGRDVLFRVEQCTTARKQIDCHIQAVTLEQAFRSTDLDVALVRESTVRAMLRGNNASAVHPLVAEALQDGLLAPYLEQNADWIDKDWPLGSKGFNYNGAGGAIQELPIAGNKAAATGYWLTCKECYAYASLDVEVHLSTSYLHLDKLSVTFKGHALVNVLLEAGLRYTGSWGPYEHSFYTYSLLSPLPSVKIGPISFTFGPVIEFGAGCKADVKAVITTTFGAKASADISLGVAYDQDSGWRWVFPAPQWTTSLIQPTLTVRADLRAEAWLYLRPKLAIGDVISMSAEVKPKAGLTGSYSSAASQCTAKQFYYKFDYGCDASFGYNLDIDISVLKAKDSRTWPYVGPWKELRSGCVTVVKANEALTDGREKANAFPVSAAATFESDAVKVVYVDGAQGNDDDQSAGGVSEPFQTVAYAVGRLAGATRARVVLASGTHWVEDEVVVPAGLSVEITSISGARTQLNSAEDTIIDCYDEARAFSVPSGAALALTGVTVQNCQTTAGSGGAVNVLPGGAFNATAARFANCMSTGSLVFSNEAVTTSAYGGAIACHDCALIVRDSYFADNTASIGAAISVCGHRGTLVVDQSKFVYNHAEKGGAIHIAGALSHVTGSRFEGNTAFLGTALSGGAIYISNAFETAAVAVVDGCTFVQNRAQHGGAVLVNIMQDGQNAAAKSKNGRFAVRISASRFVENFALGLLDVRSIRCGGAVAVVGTGATLAAGTYTEAGDVAITDCNFEENQAHLRGGAICAQQAIVSIEGSQLTENLAIPVPFNGTVLPASGGAVYCDACKASFSADTFMSGNSLSHVGGGFVVDSVTCEHTTLDQCVPCALTTMCTQCDYAHPESRGAQIVPVVCDDGDVYSTDSCVDTWGCISTPQFDAPVVYDVTPAQGSVAAGEEILIEGDNLVNIDDISDVKNIYVGNSPCLNPRLVQRNPDQIKCTTSNDAQAPNLPGPVDIQIVTVRGGAGESLVRYLYEEASTDSTLATLTVSPGSMHPLFDPRVTEYAITLGAADSSVRIYVQPSVPGVQITIDGANATATLGATLPLRRATSQIAVEVLALDSRTVSKYTLTVSMPAGSNPQTVDAMAVGVTAAIGGVVVGAAIAAGILGVVFRRRMKRAAAGDDHTLRASLVSSSSEAAL